MAKLYPFDIDVRFISGPGVLPDSPSVFILETTVLMPPEAMAAAVDHLCAALKTYCDKHGLPLPLVLVCTPEFRLRGVTSTTIDELRELLDPDEEPNP